MMRPLPLFAASWLGLQSWLCDEALAQEPAFLSGVSSGEFSSLPSLVSGVFDDGLSVLREKQSPSDEVGSLLATFRSRRGTDLLAKSSGKFLQGQDPLVEFISTLKLNLPDQSLEQGWFTLNLTGMVCSGLGIERAPSEFNATAGDPSIKLDLYNLAIECNATYGVTGPLTKMKGELVAKVVSNSRTPSSASFVLKAAIDDAAIPRNLSLTHCSLVLVFDITFSGSISAKVLQLFRKAIDSLLKKQVREQVCRDLTDLVAVNGTDYVEIVNRFMLPPGPNDGQAVRSKSDATVAAGGETAGQVETEIFGTPLRGVDSEMVKTTLPDDTMLDWTIFAPLKWMNYVLSDLMGPASIAQALEWALNGTGEITVPGTAKPIFTQSLVTQGTKFTISLFFDALRIDGVDGVREFNTLRAISSTDLQATLKMGTDKRPNLGVEAEITLRIEAGDELARLPSSTMDQRAKFALAISRPEIGANFTLPVSKERLKLERSFGQWAFGTVGCARDLLAATPSLKDLQVGFQEVAEPLSFTSVTSGALEADIATLLNNNVNFFNAKWERYMPGAIARFARSESFRKKANSLLSVELPPTPAHEPMCLAADEAAKKVRKQPRYTDYRKYLLGATRTALDRAVDGFLKYNSSSIVDALKGVPPIHVQGAEPLELQTDIFAHPKALHLQGLDHIEKLRVMLPSENDPNTLGNNLTVACPSEMEPWKPAFAVNLTLTAFHEQLSGSVYAAAPCGTLDASINATLDVWKLLEMPALFPPTCVLWPFAALEVLSLRGTMEDIGDVWIKPVAGAVHKPYEELCSMFPRLCDLLNQIGGKLQGLDRINQALNRAQVALGVQCEKDLKTLRDGEAIAASSSWRMLTGDVALLEDAPDSVDNGSTHFWMTSITAMVLLAAIYLCVAAFARRRSTATLRSAFFAGSMASEALATKTPYAWLRTLFISALLAASLVLRILANFSLTAIQAEVVLKVESLGSNAPIARVDLLTTTATSLTKNLWSIGAYESAVGMIIASNCIAFLVQAMLLLLWLTPLFREQRRVLARWALFLGRCPLVDIFFFSILACVLDNDLDFPLGASAHIRNIPLAGMYSGVISGVFSLVAARLLLCQLPKYSGEYTTVSFEVAFEDDWASTLHTRIASFGLTFFNAEANGVEVFDQRGERMRNLFSSNSKDLPSAERFPLRVSLPQRATPGAAVPLSLASTTPGACQESSIVTPESMCAASEPVGVNEPCWRTTSRGLAATLLVWSVGLWLAVPFVTVSFSGIAGSVLDTVTVSGGALSAHMSSSSDLFIGVACWLTLMVAPLCLAAGHALSLVQGSCGNGGVNAVASLSSFLRDVGGSLTMLDLFGVVLFSFWSNCNIMAVWIVSDKFESLCKSTDAMFDLDCIGATPTVETFGVIGLVIAALSFLFLALQDALLDVKRVYAVDPGATELPGFRTATDVLASTQVSSQ